MAYLGLERVARGCLPAVFAAAIMVPAMAAEQNAAAPAPAAAASEDPSKWIKTCNINPATKQQSCTTGQEVWLNQDGTARVSVAVQPKGDKKYGVGGFVPLGFVIPVGVVLTVDGDKKGLAQFMQCNPPVQDVPPGCFISAEVGDDFVAALRKGNKLGLVLTNGANQPIPIEISLAGFAKAYDGEGLDPVAARAQVVEKSKEFQEAAKAAAQRMIDKQRAETGNAPAN